MTAVADLHSKILDVHPPLGVQIYAVFWEHLAKLYVGALLEGWRHHSGNSWIRHWTGVEMVKTLLSIVQVSRI